MEISYVYENLFQKWWYTTRKFVRQRFGKKNIMTALWYSATLPTEIIFLCKFSRRAVWILCFSLISQPNNGPIQRIEQENPTDESFSIFILQISILWLVQFQIQLIKWTIWRCSNYISQSYLFSFHHFFHFLNINIKLDKFLICPIVDSSSSIKDSK